MHVLDCFINTLDVSFSKGKGRFNLKVAGLENVASSWTGGSMLGEDVYFREFSLHLVIGRGRTSLCMVRRLDPVRMRFHCDRPV
jgi:hypothetical protein